MKNIKKFLLIITLLLTSFVGIAQAETTEEITTPDPVTIHLAITTNDNTLYNKNINVQACDSSNPSSSNLKVTAYCAILQSGLSTDWNFEWAPGIFLNSINGIEGFTSQDKDGNNVYHYWSWYLNESEGTVGLNQYELQAGDEISLNFIDPVEEETHRVIGSTGSSSSGSSVSVTKKVFDLEKAFEFLASQQKENGSFGEDIYTDWTAITFGTTTEYQDQKTKLITYLKENKNGTLLTDFERHAMALMALGQNPYDFNPDNNEANYIKKITDSFDGKQFGEVNQDNDDIFALIVLQNAGYDQNETIIKNDISFILSQQKENGSWDESVDLTGAGIVALSSFNQNEQIKNALAKAKEFLKQKQEETGGWNNISSTAWAMEGILALSEKIEDWGKNDNSPFDYLAENQDTDGGIKNEYLESKIWETSYVVSILSGKTWTQIMQKFEKPEPARNAFSKADAGGEEKTTTAQVEIKKKTNQKKIEIVSAPIIDQNINQNTEEVTPSQTEKGWFKKFLKNIFSIF